jgi:hypothetical protein
VIETPAILKTGVLRRVTESLRQISAYPCSVDLDQHIQCVEVFDISMPPTVPHSGPGGSYTRKSAPDVSSTGNVDSNCCR